MTIIASESTYRNTAPRQIHPDPFVRHNVATMATDATVDQEQVRKGRTVARAYMDDPYNHTPDGKKAAPIPEDHDPNYRATTTPAEIAASVDAQLIGFNGTGMASLAQAPRFTRKRRAAGAPKMTISQVMDLRPFRVYRALAELMDESQIHSPYTQLLDLVLTAKDRTEAAAARAAAADAAFPAEQMNLEYTSQAEKILADLAADTEGETAYRRDRSPHTTNTINGAPVAIPELVYVIEADEDTTPAPGDPIDPIDPTTAADPDDEDDEGENIPVYSAPAWSLPADDYASWAEIYDREDQYRFMATTTDTTWLDQDDVWDEFDRTEPLLYA